MSFILKIVLICVALGGVGVGKFGLSGTSPEQIALGVLGVLVALVAVTFLLKFLWRFLGCLSTIIISLVLVVILLILTGTFDTIAGKVSDLMDGNFTSGTPAAANAAGTAGAAKTAGGVSASASSATASPAMVAAPDGQLIPVAQPQSSAPEQQYMAVAQPDGTTAFVPIGSDGRPLSAAATAKSQNAFTGSISGIKTGSQFVIEDLKVVLFGIDSPDAEQVCSDKRGRPYQCGQESIRQLKKFTGSTPLQCKVMVRGQNDPNLVYAVCNISNNDIGAAMVSSGWAFALPQESKVYLPHEQYAQNHRNGMWGGQFYKPDEWRAREAQKQAAKAESSSFFSRFF